MTRLSETADGLGSKTRRLDIFRFVPSPLLDLFNSSGIYLEDPYLRLSDYGWGFLCCSAITIEMLEALSRAYTSFLLSLTDIENRPSSQPKRSSL